MKTAQEWFNELPEPYRSQAIKNTKKLHNSHDSLHNAIAYSFNWDNSPEGLSYWYEIRNMVFFGYNLRPFAISNLSKERLLRLANHLQSVPNGGHCKFIFGKFLQEHECGTIGGVIGCLRYAFPEIESDSPIFASPHSGVEFLLPDLQESSNPTLFHIVVNHLFSPYNQRSLFGGIGRLLTKDTTQYEAAEHIVEFVNWCEIIGNDLPESLYSKQTDSTPNPNPMNIEAFKIVTPLTYRLAYVRGKKDATKQIVDESTYVGCADYHRQKTLPKIEQYEEQEKFLVELLSAIKKPLAMSLLGIPIPDELLEEILNEQQSPQK